MVSNHIAACLSTKMHRCMQVQLASMKTSTYLTMQADTSNQIKRQSENATIQQAWHHCYVFHILSRWYETSEPCQRIYDKLSPLGKLSLLNVLLLLAVSSDNIMTAKGGLRQHHRTCTSYDRVRFEANHTRTYDACYTESAQLRLME